MCSVCEWSEDARAFSAHLFPEVTWLLAQLHLVHYPLLNSAMLFLSRKEFQGARVHLTNEYTCPSLIHVFLWKQMHANSCKILHKSRNSDFTMDDQLPQPKKIAAHHIGKYHCPLFLPVPCIVPALLFIRCTPTFPLFPLVRRALCFSHVTTNWNSADKPLSAQTPWSTCCDNCVETLILCYFAAFN